MSREPYDPMESIAESLRRIADALEEMVSDDPRYAEADPDYMCPNCVTPWKCNGPHIPGSDT